MRKGRRIQYGTLVLSVVPLFHIKYILPDSGIELEFLSRALVNGLCQHELT